MEGSSSIPGTTINPISIERALAESDLALGFSVLVQHLQRSRRGNISPKGFRHQCHVHIPLMHTQMIMPNNPSGESVLR